MKLRALVPTAIAAAIAFAQPVQFIAQEANRAADILAAARKAIGKIDALKTFSVESTLQRNSGSMQFTSDVEILLDLPDKYLRAETPSGGGGGVMTFAGGGVSGFNGDRPLQKVSVGPGGAPGGLVIRMGGAGPAPGAEPAEKPTPEQLEQMSRTLVRNGRTEASRLMLGWFATAHPAAQVQYTFAGEAESPDGKAHVVDVKNADNFSARLFIDAQTNLPLMVTYQGPKPRMLTAGGPRPGGQIAGGAHVATQSSSSQPMTEEERKKAMADAEKQIREMQQQPPEMADYTIFFEEWRDAGGVKFPFKIRRAMDGTTTEEWSVNKVKVNPKVDPKRFAGQS